MRPPTATLSRAFALMLGSFAFATLLASTAAADEPPVAQIIIEAPLPDAPPPPADPQVVVEEAKAAPVPSAAPAAPSESGWYGGQTLGVDGVALALFALGAANGGSNPSTATSLMVTSGITYVLGGPVIHIAHGRYGTAAASLGVRLAAPVVVGAVGGVAGAVLFGAASNSTGALIGGATGAIFGLGTGVIVASVLDSAVLAHRTARAPERTGFQWSPVAAPVKGGATAGVVGRF